MKRKTRFELILFFHNGYTPKELIKLDYSPSTVYKYSGYYKKAIQKFKEVKK